MKGICFREPLFHATVEGRKTQTRRIMRPQPEEFIAGDPCVWIDELDEEFTFEDGGYWQDIKPRYKVGDIVYLKEPYYDCQNCDGLYYDLYKYTGDELPYTTSKWGNKLFMPADKARYFIKITAVRAERLQDISEGDCLKEGLVFYEDPIGLSAEQVSITYGNFLNRTPREAYAALIDKINGKGTWESNPFVWVYDYELCESIKPKE